MRSMAERDGCARSGQFRYAGVNGSDRLEAPAPIALTFGQNRQYVSLANFSSTS
jgi:hypothetical protein